MNNELKLRLNVCIDKPKLNFKTNTILYKYVGDQYNGDYIITPKANSQIVLDTSDKILLDDITIKKIPYYETSNSAGGDTVYIGSEVMINGEQ